MKKRVLDICLIACFVVTLIACVPQSVQLKGTWEFVGYKAERVESIIELDSTICFDGDGNGFYYRSSDSSAPKSFTYLLSTDHKLAIIIDGASSVVEYSIDPKTKRLSLDGLEYRLISSEVDAVKKAEAEQSPTSTPTLTLESSELPTPTPESKTSKSVSVGDVITFGKYEQDNNESNGKENIEWLVLAKEGDRVLILSKYALDCQQYNTINAEVTWETCSLRQWLNETFLTTAFNSEEQNRIINSAVAADKNPSYSTFPGNDTTDKVFLLSITEIKTYFSSDSACRCHGTAYCYVQGAIKSSQYDTCWWWTRTPGKSSYFVSYVNYDGHYHSDGMHVSLGRTGAVRPALWINSSTFSAPLSDDPNALTAPTAEMVAGAAEGKLIKSGVNMRQGPSTDTAILATGLKSGTMVTVYAEDGDFYFLQVNETKKYGYIAKSYVKLLSALGETSTGNDQPEGTVRGTISSSNLALREGPGVTYKSFGQYYEGKLVYIFHQEGDYYYVQVAGTELKGYMPAQFITAEGPVPNKDS